MAPTRRTLLRASAIGVAGSIAGVAGAAENRREMTTEQTGITGFTVQVTTHPEHGVVLTDGEGMTLYRFTRDEGGESTCYDQCAEAWPPLTVEGSPSVPDGLPGEFGTTERRDGSRQVTYNGMALYYFADDEQPGDTNGQGVNDAWFVVNPACPGATDGTDTSDDDDDDDSDDDGGNDDGDNDDGGDDDSDDSGGDDDGGDDDSDDGNNDDGNDDSNDDDSNDDDDSDDDDGGQ